MQEILNVFGVNYKLLLIQAVNFGVLLALLYYFLYRPILRLLEERRGKIEKGVRDAEKAAESLAGARGEKNIILKSAAHEAESVISEARQKAREEEKELRSNAKKNVSELLKKAEEEAALRKEQIIAESKEDIARMAILAAERLLRKQERG